MKEDAAAAAFVVVAMAERWEVDVMVVGIWRCYMGNLVAVWWGHCGRWMKRVYPSDGGEGLRSEGLIFALSGFIGAY